jgi:hypothetical protein
MKKYILILLILISNLSLAQDIEISFQQEDFLKYNKFQKSLKLNKKVIKLEQESLEELFERVYPNAELHHGIFQIKNWVNQHGRYIVCFIRDNETFDVGLIVGVLFEPIGKNAFRLNKIGEWSDECRGTAVQTVFRHGERLFVLVQQDCSINGVFNNVFTYNNIVSNNKLQLENSKSEHCGYWWRGDNDTGDYVYPQGGEDTSGAKYIECNLNSYEKIIKSQKKK